jgi:hypothetical protein
VLTGSQQRGHLAPFPSASERRMNNHNVRHEQSVRRLISARPQVHSITVHPNGTIDRVLSE